MQYMRAMTKKRKKEKKRERLENKNEISGKPSNKNSKNGFDISRVMKITYCLINGNVERG